jgi:16S rRNA (cytosine1402-N4)-methyltransferase
MEEQQQHKRRKRYKGTHPRKFSEKYKELNPEKYQDDVKKIIGQGKTPAGMHISIMVQEILDFLQIQPAHLRHSACVSWRKMNWSACW